MKTAKVFEIHCWNEEQEWITFVLRYGKLKDDVFQGCHYGYSYEKAWAVHRVSYPWADKKPRTVRTLEMQLEREMVKIPSKPFATPEKGIAHEILNPVTGVIHTFTVREYEEREMDPSHFQDEGMEWPTKYSIMTYTLFPELEEVYLKDACQGKSSRRRRLLPSRRNFGKGESMLFFHAF